MERAQSHARAQRTHAGHYGLCHPRGRYSTTHPFHRRARKGCGSGGNGPRQAVKEVTPWQRARREEKARLLSSLAARTTPTTPPPRTPGQGHHSRERWWAEDGAIWSFDVPEVAREREREKSAPVMKKVREGPNLCVPPCSFSQSKSAISITRPRLITSPPLARSPAAPPPTATPDRLVSPHRRLQTRPRARRGDRRPR